MKFVSRRVYRGIPADTVMRLKWSVLIQLHGGADNPARRRRVAQIIRASRPNGAKKTRTEQGKRSPGGAKPGPPCRPVLRH
jgi:hypothetical protein